MRPGGDAVRPEPVVDRLNESVECSRLVLLELISNTPVCSRNLREDAVCVSPEFDTAQ